MKIISLGLLCLIVLGLVSGCKEKEAQRFAFSSGGAYHPSGYGEWQVELASKGDVKIVHNRAGELKDYGAFTLKEEENLQVWKLIAEAGITNLDSSTRLGMPDEAQYTFSLNGRDVKIWLGDAQENENLMALVNMLGSLIETRTGQKPVLQ